MSMFRNFRSFLPVTSSITALALFGAGACGDNDEHVDDDHDHPDAAVATADAAPAAIALSFAGEIDGAPFACGATYPGLGAAASDFVAADFRLYLSDIRLLDAGGNETPLTLDVDDFQTADGIALLDFEDGAAGCDDGTSATHTTITGTAPAGTYAGVRFTIGIPSDLNHLDAATAQPPLNLIPMWWAWQFGYKFIKIDGAVAGNGFFLHVGSTGCPGDDFEQPPTGPCADPNRIDVEFTGLDLTADTIVIDPAPVYADVDLSLNTVDTAPGCMSFPGDPECDTIFPKLGLPFGANPAGTQLLVTTR